MKKLLAAVALALTVSMPVWAGPTQSTPVSMNVTNVLDLEIAVYKADPQTSIASGAPLPAMDFGELNRDLTWNVQRGKDAHWVEIYTNSTGRPYIVKSTMAPLTSGDRTLPPAMVMTPVSATSASGNLNIQGDALLTGSQNAIMSDKTIYTSNPNGTSAKLSLVYGISGGETHGAPFAGWQPVPLDQRSGNYTSTIIYTIALS